MPEYLSPGVFVEEVSYRQKSIEGVSTSTTGFVGPCGFGPVFDEPALLTSYSDFERIYGGMDKLKFEDHDNTTNNFIAHAVQAYFSEGGKRLYIARVFEPISGAYPPPERTSATSTSGKWSDGHARWEPLTSPMGDIFLKARHPGKAGNFKVSFLFKYGQDALDTSDAENILLRGLANFSVVWARTSEEMTTSPVGSGQLYWIEKYFDETRHRDTFRLRRDDPDGDAGEALSLDQLESVRPVTVTVATSGHYGDDITWEDLSFHPGRQNALTEIFAVHPAKRSISLYVPLVFETQLKNGAAIAEALMNQANIVDNTPINSNLNSSRSALRTMQVQLTGGNDGNQPDSGEYQGTESQGMKSGLMAFEDLEDISIVAAPGSTFDYTAVSGTDIAEAVMRQLITHCERMRYRVAILDSVNGNLPGDIRALKAKIDSTRAALYYPWIRIFDPITETEILNPPSGHMAGIYARNDIERGVHKSPANEVARLALGFEILLNKAQQEVLNPEGINCLRFFEGRGFRIWGARTASSDPEWKYLNVRRYFAFLERSIEKGTQWAVFENNGETLWTNIRQTIEDFLFNEWKEDHLAGADPKEAYFVRCDRTTMTQNDLDNGRMICLVGVAPLRPAEFVIFRIGQKTLDNR
ncbi:phage tail sheath subtilisin-like domain-containing protein [uncultured Desulfobacter sp.]|uniref:phage tail sheath family protein n=1 Tax=uncultured Desulfobacter sp. TaxID=240139 RepID=UPI002AA8AE43|nr:phage tail sheath subtilisin-like domain-containing protein [uncultured Desulfobacter sp.]